MVRTVRGIIDRQAIVEEHIKMQGKRFGSPTGQCSVTTINFVSNHGAPLLVQDGLITNREIRERALAIGVDYQITEQVIVRDDLVLAQLGDDPQIIRASRIKERAVEYRATRRVTECLSDPCTDEVGLVVTGGLIRQERDRDLPGVDVVIKRKGGKQIEVLNVSHAVGIMPVSTSKRTVYSVVDSMSPGGVTHKPTIKEAVREIMQRYGGGIVSVFKIATLDNNSEKK